ncbi:MAG TPA: MFS transporter [Vicinamibacterales bacterium]|nr:MFS transporter [Vicinamibacterales bacterium]
MATETGGGDRREIVGWMMYDWANSAYITTVVTVLIGPYLTALAQQAVGENGVLFDLGPLGHVTAKSFFPYCISLSVFLQVFLLPVIGAVADYTHLKKRLMIAFCYLGSIATCLLFFAGRHVGLGGLLLVVSNLSFGASIVLYNAFLNDIVGEERRDEVSSRGYAVGYLGGGLLLALNLGMILAAARLGISKDLAVRLSLASAGVWWGGFAVFTFARLKPRGAARELPAGASLLRIGFTELAGVGRQLRALPQTLRYLAAYLFFNDGIQTVISIASVFLAQELFVARGLPVDESFLVGIILMVQFVAFAGSLVFERIAAAIGTRNAILLSLVLWAGIVVYAYGWLETTTQAWAMGAVIAVVLGGSQALSRSLFSQMIPPGHEASFFGLYEIAERGTSWIGPLVFGAVVGATNSYRQAILSLIVLFVAGIAILAATDTARAIREARTMPGRAAEGD